MIDKPKDAKTVVIRSDEDDDDEELRSSSLLISEASTLENAIGAKATQERTRNSNLKDIIPLEEERHFTGQAYN